jgi:hypothetical protein
MTETLIDQYSEFFTAISRGDGSSCPLYNTCIERSTGYSCIHEQMDHLGRLRGGRSTDAEIIALGKRRNCRAIRWVKMLANDYLEKAGDLFTPQIPEDIALLADKTAKIEIRLLPLKLHRGAVWKLSNSWVIFLDSNATTARRRFTLFHEVFHILTQCKHAYKLTGKAPEKGLFNEIIADNFARDILVPHRWLLDTGALIKDPGQLAKICGVPRTIILSLLRDNGLM